MRYIEEISKRDLSWMRIRALKGAKGVAEAGETRSSVESVHVDSCSTLKSKRRLALAPEKNDCSILSPTLRIQNHTRSASRPKPPRKPALRGGAPTDAGERHVGETSNHNRDLNAVNVEDEAAFYDILKKYENNWYGQEPISSSEVPQKSSINQGQSEPSGLDLEDYELGDCEVVYLFYALFLSGSLQYEYCRGQMSPP